LLCYYFLVYLCNTYIHVLYIYIYVININFLADIYRSRQGLETMHYDAFLLYADEDIDFVNEVVRKLETEYELKVS